MHGPLMFGVICFVEMKWEMVWEIEFVEVWEIEFGGVGNRVWRYGK